MEKSLIKVEISHENDWHEVTFKANSHEKIGPFRLATVVLRSIANMMGIEKDRQEEFFKDVFNNLYECSPTHEGMLSVEEAQKVMNEHLH